MHTATPLLTVFSSRSFVLTTLVALAAIRACAHYAFAGDDDVDFARDVAPIVERHCIRCHQPSNRKGDISLATFADLEAAGYVDPSEPRDSYLLELVTPVDGEPPTMPKEGDPLSDDEIAMLTRWIAAGARWPDEVVIREPAKAGRDWWSLRPLAAVEPPSVDGLPAEWSDNAIDRFVAARLAAEGLAPNPPADRRTLIRRVTYDLAGLPPTPEEVDAFVADEAPHAYERLVDRLLESPSYGEQWGRHWLDVVRFGESVGFETNRIVDNAWPFRDYVIRSFNEDKPFDQLVREHLAGDVIAKNDPDVEVGTAFLVCGPFDSVNNQDAKQQATIRANTLDEVIRATGEAFLGITIGCARCHDHKFDPVLQEDYYGWYATFAGVYHGSRDMATPAVRRERDDALRPLEAARKRLTAERKPMEDAIRARARDREAELAAAWTRPPADRYGTEEVFPPVKARYVRLVVEDADRDGGPNRGARDYRIDEFEIWTADDPPVNVALASRGGRAEGASRIAEDFADAYGPQLTIDGMFGARWIAAGPTLTITLGEPQRVGRVYFSSDRTRSIGPKNDKTKFVGDYRIEVSLDGRSWQEVANSYDREPPNAERREARLFEMAMTDEERQELHRIDAQLAEIRRQLNAVPPLPSWSVGEFRAAEGPFHVFLGGDASRPGDEVVPASFSQLDDLPSRYELPAASDESERRLALADWIVAADNPLTPRVLANRLWHYHFGTGIVDTPSNFGYMGGRPTHPELLDWLAGQLLADGWRLKPLHRLIVTSAAYRQSSAWREEAGRLDAGSRLLWRFPSRRLAAEEIRDTMLAVAGQLDERMGGPGFRLYRYLQDNVSTYIPLDEPGPETYRRAVYHQNARSAPVDVMSDFDCPDPAFAAPRRTSTTTPLQALTLLNHHFTLDMARFLADRLERESGSDPAAQARLAWRLAYGREPSSEESNAAVNLIEQHGLRALTRAMLNSNEFIYVD